MIKYYIRTKLERKLDESVGRELGEKYTLLVDYEHKPVESFIKQLEIISEYDSVLLEDDVILCKDFKSRIEEVIKEYPDMIINFFTLPSNYFTTHITDTPFKFNQCTYYPKGISKLIAKGMKTKVKYHNCGYDLIEGWVIRELNISYVLPRPCLVQHIDSKSLISKSSERRSPYFIDYLDELNIEYNDARKPENKARLIALMKEKFKN